MYFLIIREIKKLYLQKIEEKNYNISANNFLNISFYIILKNQRYSLNN